MFRFLSLILVGFVCFYLVLNLGFFFIFFFLWVNIFVGLCLCVRGKIVRSEERKKKCNQTHKPNVKSKQKKKKKMKKTRPDPA